MWKRPSESNAMFSLVRRNLAFQQEGEQWRPPLFSPSGSLKNRLTGFLRRFLDLQAGSIWRDLAAALANAQGTVLDVGCGAQVYRHLLPNGGRYQGIDLAEAKNRFGYPELPDTIYVAADQWPIDEGTVDHVLCTEVLEHVPEPQVFLTRIQKSLRPGGRLVLTVPFAARWHYIPFDYWRFTPSGLRSLLEAAGFEKIEVYARGNPLTVACQKLMVIPMFLLFRPGELSVGGLAAKLSGLLLFPVVVVLACVANATRGWDWGDDCLGYTAFAYRGGRES